MYIFVACFPHFPVCIFSFLSQLLSISSPSLSPSLCPPPLPPLPSPPLALGTLPYIDNFANIGGFFFGIVSAFVLVPYISIGKWDRVKKFTIVTIFFPTLVFMFLVVIFFFYVLPDPSFCSWCSYINCIPYTETFCDDFLGNVQNFVPTVPGN